MTFGSTTTGDGDETDRIGTHLHDGALRRVTSSASASPIACVKDWPFTEPAKSVAAPVMVPSQVTSQVYDGTVVRPEPAPHGKQPAVVIMHGRGATQCSLWWAARLLAAHGYVAMTIDNPTSTSVAHQIDAVQSAMQFLRSASNPFAIDTNSNDIGLVGHSLGAAAISFVQEAPHPFLKAIVALDNLRAVHDGDAAAFLDCQQPPSGGPVIPRVPALGEASEAPCATEGVPSHPADFTDKRLAFKDWRANGKPSMETVMNGFMHTTFAGPPDPTDPVGTAVHGVRLRQAGYYMQAWLDLWLRGDPTAAPRLRSCTPAGAPITTVLSSKAPNLPLDPPDAYHSSLYLPGLGINDDDLLAFPPCP
jgi:hypothetical protein